MAAGAAGGGLMWTLVRELSLTGTLGTATSMAALLRGSRRVDHSISMPRAPQMLTGILVFAPKGAGAETGAGPGVNVTVDASANLEDVLSAIAVGCW